MAQPHARQHDDAGVYVPCEEFNELKSSPLAAFANAIALTDCEGIVASRQNSALGGPGEVQSYLDEAVENCSELIGMADREGYFTFANRAFLQALGYSKEELIGKHLGALLADNPPALAREIGGKVLQGEGWRGECHLSRRDGSSCPILLTVGPVRDNEGRVVGSFGVGRDISDQKQAHEALQRSEEQFRELAENIREVFFILTLNPLRVIYLSPAYEAIWGHLRQEVYDRTAAWIDAIHPADREQAMRSFGQAQHGETAEYEYRIVRPDDSVRWISARAFPVYDSEGKFCRVVGFAEDVTERKKIQDQIQQNEIKFRTLFEMANDAILILHDGKFSDCNLRSETLFGCRKEDIIGRTPLDFSPPKQPDGRLSAEMVATRIQAAMNGQPQFFAQQHRRYDGTVFDAEVSINWVITSGETYLQGIIRDVSERTQAEIALREVHSKLKIANGKLEHQVQEAAKLTELVDILQSCQTAEEACRIIGNILPTMLSPRSGSLCITSSSRNVVEVAASWGDTLASEKIFAPDSCWALRRGRIHRVNDPASPLRCAHVSKSLNNGHICVPLAAQGETLGVLCVEYCSVPAGSAVERGSDQGEVLERQVIAVGERISLALANLRLREVLRGQSIRDPLTGLFNRRFMEESLERELRRAVRGKEQVALLMLDIDHFKRFNDTFGHQAGDALLRALGSLLQESIRGQDVVCRYGGEELAVVLPGASLDAARKRAELLRHDVKQLNAQYGGQLLGAVTFSIGVAVFPDNGDSAEHLLKAADDALYRAKEAGRDRVIAA